MLLPPIDHKARHKAAEKTPRLILTCPWFANYSILKNTESWPQMVHSRKMKCPLPLRLSIVLYLSELRAAQFTFVYVENDIDTGGTRAAEGRCRMLLLSSITDLYNVDQRQFTCECHLGEPSRESRSCMRSDPQYLF
jgi:hypothetical protein